MFSGHYRLFGPPVSRSRLRDALNRVKAFRGDPVRRSIRRRVYSVKGPLSLWHMDGHHKLIRWKFVIHGCIDGYSRVITFLKVSTDNTASTVLKHFLRAVKEWGLPLSVRSDHGGENVAVCYYMMSARCENRTPFITGKSVHNQRIERLWRDAFEGCLQPFHSAFYDWENGGYLNPSSDLDLCAVHLTCHRLLCQTVERFCDGWNLHPLSTEQNSSPLRKFQSGVHHLWNEEGDECPELLQDQNKIDNAFFNVPNYSAPITFIENFIEVNEMECFQEIIDYDSITIENAFECFISVKNYLQLNFLHCLNNVS